MVMGDVGANGLNIKEMITKCSKLKWNHELQVKGFSQAGKVDMYMYTCLEHLFPSKAALMLQYSQQDGW